MSFNTDDISGFHITLDAGNSGTTRKCQFVLPLPASTLKLPDHQVTLLDFQIYNSIPNVSLVQGNTTFSFIGWDDVAPAPITVNLLQGLGSNSAIMSIEDMNGVLESAMFNAGYYLLDTAGNPFYFLKIEPHTSYNRVLLTSIPVPLTLSGSYLNYTNPGGKALPTTAVKYMQLVVPPTLIRTNLGFTAGTYPIARTGFSTEQRVLSTDVPQIDTVTSLILQCSLCGPTDFAPFTPNLLAQIPITAPALSNQNYQPTNLQWRRIPQKDYNDVTITICDQNGTPLDQLMENFSTSFTIKIMRRA